MRNPFVSVGSSFGLTLLLALCLPVGAALAAPAPGDLRELQRRQEQILQQQEDLHRRQEEEFFRSRERAPAGEEPAVLPPAASRTGAPCARIDRVRVSGVSLFSADAIQALTLPYENRCLTLAEVTALLRDISNSYIRRGYVTARAFVDPGREERGVLNVLVVEGAVEKIILNDGDPADRYRGRLAFPGLDGMPLNLRDFEQGLDQLNRLPSGNAEMEFTPGESLGGTIVLVSDRQKRTWRSGLGVDNLGQKATGQSQYTLSFEKDNFMGLGDQWAAYWTESSPYLDGVLFGHKEIGHTRNFSAFGSIPYGYWLFSANFSRFAYDTTIFGMNTSYATRGETECISAQAERVLHRDADSKTALSFSLACRSVATFIEGVKLITSSYLLSTGEFSLSHNRRLLGGVAGFRFGYTRGLPLFGSTRIADSTRLTPRSRFDKYGASLSWYRPFSAGGERLYWNLEIQGQYSPQTLYGPERIQIGGRSSVRGFHEDSITGDAGVYARNELGWDLPWFASLREAGPVNGWRIFGAYDYGTLRRDKKDPYERGRMQGVAVGLRTQGALGLEFVLSKALDYPRFIRARDVECYASLKYTL
jgi:hemolysin activation/secretion protein